MCEDRPMECNRNLSNLHSWALTTPDVAGQLTRAHRFPLLPVLLFHVLYYLYLHSLYANPPAIPAIRFISVFLLLESVTQNYPRLVESLISGRNVESGARPSWFFPEYFSCFFFFFFNNFLFSVSILFPLHPPSPPPSSLLTFLKVENSGGDSFVRMK